MRSGLSSPGCERSLTSDAGLRFAAASGIIRLTMSTVYCPCSMLPVVATWTWVVVCRSAVLLGSPSVGLIMVFGQTSVIYVSVGFGLETMT